MALLSALYKLDEMSPFVPGFPQTSTEKKKGRREGRQAGTASPSSHSPVLIHLHASCAAAGKATEGVGQRLRPGSWVALKTSPTMVLSSHVEACRRGKEVLILNVVSKHGKHQTHCCV